MASGDVRRQTQEMLVRFEKEVGRRRRPPPPYEGGFDDNDSDEDGNIGKMSD